MAGEIVSLLPTGLTGTGVLGLFAWYSKTSRDDRREFRDAYTASQKRFEDQLSEAKTEFEQRLKEEHARLLETEMTAQHEGDDYRRRLADAETVIMGERAARRDAELELESAKIRLKHADWRIKLAQGKDVSFDDEL